MSYPGGKGAAGVVQTIINQQPPHDTYVEAFLGSGAVMRAKRPARVNIGLEIDAAALAGFDDGTMSDIQLENTDALKWLKAWKPHPDQLVYCDPPYPLTSRATARRLYRHEMTEAQHRELLQILSSLPAMVQISTYPNPLYAELLKDWRLLTFQATTRGGLKTEHLYMNYPPPAALHDYRFLGANFRQRERIQRKTKRWTARIASLPELERLALYSAMASTIAAPDVEQPLRAARSRKQQTSHEPSQYPPQAPPEYCPAMKKAKTGKTGPCGAVRGRGEADCKSMTTASSSSSAAPFFKKAKIPVATRQFSASDNSVN